MWLKSDQWITGSKDQTYVHIFKQQATARMNEVQILNM
jgi:hypothetical protein